MLACYVVLDLETTGGNAVHDRVTEIAAVRVEGGKEVARWSTLVNPGVLQAVDDRPDRFEGETLRLVETLATAAAVAIENARLFEETRLRADRLAILNEISTAINQPDSLAAVCTTATKELTRALNVTQAAVALFDEPRRRLYIVADAPALGSPPLVGVDLPLENNLSMQRILETRAPLAIYDAQNDPLLAALHEVMQQRHVRSILIVPLLVQGEVIGTFGCDAVNAPRHFTQEDIDLTVTVANLIAARIEQARLFEAERDQRLLFRLDSLNERQTPRLVNQADCLIEVFFNVLRLDAQIGS